MLFVKKILGLTLLGVSLFLLAACRAEEKVGIQADMNGIPYRVISAVELQTMLEGKDFVMVNVHTPWEGDIPQTDLRLPYDEISGRLDQLPLEKDAKIVVYCLTSGMAKKAVATLLSEGYANIWMLEGGTTAWQEAGYLIEKE